MRWLRQTERERERERVGGIARNLPSNAYVTHTYKYALLNNCTLITDTNSQFHTYITYGYTLHR